MTVYQPYNRAPDRGARAAAAQQDQGGDPGTTSKTRIREKNRQAQRRFRERQRTLVNELRVQVDLLCRAVNEGRSAIVQLERENRIMKALLMQHNVDQGAAAAPAAAAEEGKGAVALQAASADVDQSAAPSTAAS